jgi:hypothetical protein
MKPILLTLLTIVLLTGCSKPNRPQPIKTRIEYITKIKYIYLPSPCTKDKLRIKYIPCFNAVQAKQKIVTLVKNKPIQKTAPKYHQPKTTTIFAPEKYIKFPNKKMDFMIGYNQDGSEFVYLEGGFGLDTYKNFLKFIKKSHTTAKEIKINSNGGLVKTAMQIGAYVHDHRWDTGVDEEMRCLSACGFVYLAGIHKTLEGRAIVGLHRPYNPNQKDTSQSISRTKKEYLSYWDYIRASKSLYDEMMEVPRDELLVLDRSNIDEYIDVDIK